MSDEDENRHFFVRLRKSSATLSFFDELFSGNDVADLRPKKKSEGSAERSEPPEEKSLFDPIVERFWDDLEHLVEGTQFLTQTTSSLMEPVFSRISENFLKKHGSLISDRGRHRLYALPRQQRVALYNLIEDRRRAGRFVEQIPNILLPTLVSHIETLLFSTIRALIKKNPAMIGNVNREFSLTELHQLKSIEQLRDEIIDTHIRSIMGGSHLSQIEWIEKKTKINFEFDDAILRNFKRMCLTRNIIIHNAGQVSQQFYEDMKELGNEISPDDIGKAVRIPIDVFRSDVETSIIIGVVISQMVWRKVDKPKTAQADVWVTNISYTLIKDGRYGTAAKLLEMCNKKIEHWEDSWAKHAAIVNSANAQRLLGNRDKALEVLSSIQWKTMSLQLQMCVNAIRGDFDECTKLLETHGTSVDIGAADYHEWPVFDELREHVPFQEAFVRKFGEPIGGKAYVGAAERSQSEAPNDLN